MKAVKWNHHKPLLLRLKPIRGFYLPDASNLPKAKKYYGFKIRNKAYRNMAYWINSFITNSLQPFYNTGGADRGVLQFRANVVFTGSPNQTLLRNPFQISYGSSTSPHDITRNDLYSRHSALSWIGGFSWTVKESSRTLVRTYHTYAFHPPSLSVGEAGLYAGLAQGTLGVESFLLARAIIDPVTEKTSLTQYEEGWEIEFPSPYTRFIPHFIATCEYGGGSGVDVFKDVNGVDFALRRNQPSAGSPDARIGSDNTTPNPDDYNLKSPIGSLSSQSQSVEIDTTLQECRIVRQGTYTPTTNVYLGEIGLFINVYDSAGTTRTVMLARGVWDTPVLLLANTTYTIGIVLVM